MFVKSGNYMVKSKFVGIDSSIIQLPAKNDFKLFIFRFRAAGLDLTPSSNPPPAPSRWKESAVSEEMIPSPARQERSNELPAITADIPVCELGREDEISDFKVLADCDVTRSSNGLEALCTSWS